MKEQKVDKVNNDNQIISPETEISKDKQKIKGENEDFVYPQKNPNKVFWEL